MKRLHVNVTVKDIPQAVEFYSTLFDMKPSVRKDDYAKWMLDDPRVNFAITDHGDQTGVSHLGIQTEDRNELEEVYGRLQAAEAPLFEEGNTVCCYAKSEKTWVTDPAGVPWETFFTFGDSPVFGNDIDPAQAVPSGTCCG